MGLPLPLPAPIRVRFQRSEHAYARHRGDVTGLENWVNDLPDAKREYWVVRVDQAGWHMSKKLRVPDGIVLYALPSYTPEFQTVEASWPLFREPLANRFFGHLDELTDTLAQRCRWISDHPDLLKARCAWRWLIIAERPV